MKRETRTDVSLWCARSQSAETRVRDALGGAKELWPGREIWGENVHVRNIAQERHFL